MQERVLIATSVETRRRLARALQGFDVVSVSSAGEVRAGTRGVVGEAGEPARHQRQRVVGGGRDRPGEGAIGLAAAAEVGEGLGAGHCLESAEPPRLLPELGRASRSGGEAGVDGRLDPGHRLDRTRRLLGGSGGDRREPAKQLGIERLGAKVCHRAVRLLGVSGA